MQTVDVANIRIGPGQPLAVIAGPCVLESADLCLRVGEQVRDWCAEFGLGFIFKASYDKANRSSVRSKRGPGLDEGLGLLEQIKSKLGVPVTTDIHNPAHAQAAAEVVDVLQIPAFLCRQTDLLLAAAQTGAAVNVKKGQFLSPGEMQSVVQKLEEGFKTAKPRAAAGPGILLTERGTFFGYQRLVNDFIGVGDLMELGWPVCFDVTHSTQLPGASGSSQAKVTGGRPDRAPLLARCAVAAGVQAVFIETHPDPAQALSDAATMLPLPRMGPLLQELARLHEVTASVAGE
ncbi:MAG: 3-deoxy-8-phosphooctulonate synthase [Phycisphaeraceae bacterium]